MFNLATLFVDVVARTSQFDQAISKTHRQLSALDVGVATFAGNIAASMVKAAASMAVDLFPSTIGSAAHLEETVNKINVVFGGASREVIANAEEMAKAFSLPRQALLDTGSTLGMLGKVSGLSKDEAAKFGVEMTKLAADAHSFYDVPIEEALRKIQSGLSGMSRPLREFGVFINAAMVQEKAMAMGFGRTKGEISEGEKVMARAALITEQMADAQGDLARTFGSTENQIAAFWGALSNLGQDIGATLMPAFDQLLAVANTTMRGMSDYFEENKGMFEGWVSSFMDGMNMIGTMWRNIGDVWTIATLNMGKEFIQMTALVKSYWGDVGPYLITSIAGIVGQFTVLNTSLAGLFLLPGEYLFKGMAAALEGIGSLWDAYLDKFAAILDWLYRPLNDLANKINGTTGTVETQVGQLKGMLGVAAEGGKAMSQIFSGGRDELDALGEAGKRGVERMAVNAANSMRGWGEAAKSGAESATMAIDDQIKAAQDRMSGRELAAAGKTATPKSELALLAESAARSSRMGPQGGDEEGGAAKKNEIVGAADFAAKLRLAQNANDVPQKQLSELEQIRAQEKANGEMLGKALDHAFVAVLG